MKIKINEKQLKMFVENEMDEMAYPESFSMEEFKSLTSFKKRIAYCRQHLKRLGSGSLRMVFQIDDEKVLKLAMNRKGLAQNEAEIRGGSDLYSTLANIFDYDENDLWLEMELVRKVKPQDFKRIVGYDFNTICEYLDDLYYRQTGSLKRQKQFGHFNYRKFSQEEIDEIYENEWMYDLTVYVSDTNIPVGDLKKIDSWGIVTRDFGEWIVIIDSGLTEDVWDNHYR